MKKNITIYLVAAFCNVLSPIFLSAQSDGNNNQPFQQAGQTNDPPPDDSGPPPPNDAPIDGGLGLLLVAGAAYGVKKYREGRKRVNTGVL